MHYIRSLAVCVIILFPGHPLVAADPSPTMTNESIVQLVGWHFSSAEIISRIHDFPTQFDLSSAGLQYLTGHGVTDTGILDAMFHASVKSARASTQAVLTPRTSTAAAPVSNAVAPSPPDRPAVNPPSQGDSQPQVAANQKSPASSNQPCYVIAAPATMSGSNSSYIYRVQCSSGVTPNSMAIVAPLITNPSGFALEQGIASQSSSSDANNTTFTFTFSPGTDDKRLRLNVPTASTEEKAATYYIAFGAMTDVAGCVSADKATPASLCSKGAIFVPVPKAPPATVATCPTQPYYEFKDVSEPTLDGIQADAPTSGTPLTGTVKGATTGKVQICSGSTGKSLGDPVKVDQYGKFSLTLLKDTKLSNGDSIVAQYIKPGVDGAPDQYGSTSSASTVKVGDCTKLTPTSLSAPDLSLSQPDSNSKISYSGKVSGSPPSGSAVRICVNHIPSAGAGTANIKPDGTFTSESNSFKVQANDMVGAQVVTSDTPPKYSPLSAEQTISSAGLTVGKATNNQPVAILIGGVEYGGYSSQAQSTDAFLNIFYKGPVNSKGFSGWGRIRLTSAPQATTNGVGSVISNPTGLTTQNYSNVGQVLDYTFGPSWRIPKTKHWDIIGSFGAITPLSSQNTPITFVAPPAGSVECQELTTRFSSSKSYTPGLTPAPPGSKTCLSGGYTDIAFANQDRSNFLMKYGAGVRTAYPFGCKTSSGNCSPAYAAADATLGQDSSVTGGGLHGVVFKVDGILPIMTGNSGWLYLFGSAYMRLAQNVNQPPLILQTPNPPITVPSSTVIVLPLRQPNRDYYRLGVGLNINQLWCKAFGSGCASTADSGGNSTAPTIKLDTTSAKKGSPDLTLDITGTNFINNTSTVQWTPKGGTAATLSSKFVSSTELTATVKSALLANSGSATITVNNGASGGTSNAVTFTITN